MAETTQYFRKVSDIINVPAPDDLAQRDCKSDTIIISTPGNYPRGTLLMSSDGTFIPATAEGLSAADDICILADNLSLVEDDGQALVAAYFSGVFNPDLIILPYELEDDNHYALLEVIAPILRQHCIFLN